MIQADLSLANKRNNSDDQQDHCNTLSHPTVIRKKAICLNHRILDHTNQNCCPLHPKVCSHLLAWQQWLLQWPTIASRYSDSSIVAEQSVSLHRRILPSPTPVLYKQIG